MMKCPFQQCGDNSIKAAGENNESRSSPGWWPPTGFLISHEALLHLLGSVGTVVISAAIRGAYWIQQISCKSQQTHSSRGFGCLMSSLELGDWDRDTTNKLFQTSSDHRRKFEIDSVQCELCVCNWVFPIETKYSSHCYWSRNKSLHHAERCTYFISFISSKCEKRKPVLHW